MALHLIFARAANGVIGRNGQLPWHLPEDLAHFKRTTLGCPVIMGRKTWDSLPARFRPLPGRDNIVVTRHPLWQGDGAQVAHSLDQALTLARRQAAPRIFVIGGAQLYAQALPLADELMLTEIDADLPGDAHFPAFDRTEFVELQRDVRHSAGPPACDYAFVIYQRRRQA